MTDEQRRTVDQQLQKLVQECHAVLALPASHEAERQLKLDTDRMVRGIEGVVRKYLARRPKAA